jgi:hypothetical protein
VASTPENSSEVVKLGASLLGQDGQQGPADLRREGARSGNLILRARTQDGAGNAAVAQPRGGWPAAAGGSPPATTTASTCCRRKSATSRARTASFQVRMPFRSATALITVEREGVIDTYVRR